MRIEGQISRMTPSENNQFMPIIPRLVFKKDATGTIMEVGQESTEIRHIPSAREIVESSMKSDSRAISMLNKAIVVEI